MGPDPGVVVSEQRFHFFARYANLHLTLRSDGDALSGCLCEIPLHYAGQPEATWKDE